MATDSDDKTTLRAFLAAAGKIGKGAPCNVSFHKFQGYRLDRENVPEEKGPERAAALADSVVCYSDVSADLPAERHDEADAISHGALVFSDYSGGTVERSNVRVVRDMTGCRIVYGGHGTEQAFFLLDLPMTEEEAGAILETLESLNSYPVLSEGDWWELESESETEAWRDYGAGDFRSELQKTVDREEDVVVIDDDDKLRSIYAVAAEAGNVDGGPGYIFEEGGGVHYSIREVVECTPVYVFAALGAFKVDPDPILRTLSSSKAGADDIAALRERAAGIRYLLGAGQAIRYIAGKIASECKSADVDYIIARARVADGTAFEDCYNLETLESPDLRKLVVEFRVWDSASKTNVRRTFTVDPWSPFAVVEDKGE